MDNLETSRSLVKATLMYKIVLMINLSPSNSPLQNSAIIWKPLSSDRSDNDRWDRTFYILAIVVTAIAGEWFHMIAMITGIAFFFSAIAVITAMVKIIW